MIDVNRSHISKIEAPNMNTQISLCLLFEVADALEVEVAKLFTNDKKSYNSVIA